MQDGMDAEWNQQPDDGWLNVLQLMLLMAASESLLAALALAVAFLLLQ